MSLEEKEMLAEILQHIMKVQYEMDKKLDDITKRLASIEALMGGDTKWLIMLHSADVKWIRQEISSCPAE